MKALSQKRRHPLAAIALLLMGLLVTGGLYAVATTVNQAKADTTTYSASDVEQGGKLFAANCATCHGMGAQRLRSPGRPLWASAPPLLTSRSPPAACPCR